MKDEVQIIKISVRNLIEFVMRSGDIDNTFKNTNSLMEGIKAHKYVQSGYNGKFETEKKLDDVSLIEKIEFHVSGRLDGLIFEKDTVVIDEIKSTSRDLSTINCDNKLHWAQAMCYGYFYSKSEKLEKITLSLTYINIETKQTKIFRREVGFEDLKEFYLLLLRKYIKFSKLILKYQKERDLSLENINFPYNGWRKGQRKLSLAVFKTVDEHKNVLINAPTGIGKTISTIFASVFFLKDNKRDKIFYLTAKNTQAEEALKAILKLKEKNLVVKVIALTGKEKICINDKVKCNPTDCPYAKGHFDRVNEAVFEIMEKEEILNYDLIVYYATKYRVCPFELQLDLTNYSDIIIGDYNYVFDPLVSLKRFFETEEMNYIYLVDESHNIVDRLRNSYSKSLKLSDFMAIKNMLNTKENQKIIRHINRLENDFYNLVDEKNVRELYFSEKYNDKIDKNLFVLRKFLEEFLIEHKEFKDYEKVLEIYFSIISFIKIADFFDDGFYYIIENTKEDIVISIKNVNPRQVVKKYYRKKDSFIFFSATLEPINYFVEVLGLKEAYILDLQMPFSKDNYEIINYNLSTRYYDRTENISQLIDIIHTFVTSKKGNYFIFFPSFEYMFAVFEKYKNCHLKDDIVCQNIQMTEKQRYEFLSQFTYESRKIAFVVLGGVFGEGVDLTGDRLIATAIISIGMPKISFERNLIKHYFDSKHLNGFDYAYTYPGLNKVFQAAGRVIRTENDKGIILLIDDRYKRYDMRKLYPRHWEKMIQEKGNLTEILKEFWNKHEKEDN